MKVLETIKEFNFLDPQGNEISFKNFDSRDKANEYLDKWVSFYKGKNYYSPILGLIPFEKIKDFCEPIEIELSLIQA